MKRTQKKSETRSIDATYAAAVGALEAAGRSKVDHVTIKVTIDDRDDEGISHAPMGRDGNEPKSRCDHAVLYGPSVVYSKKKKSYSEVQISY